MSNDTNSNTMFSGEFRHAIDDKHRVTIPAPWRQGEGDEFYLTLGRGGSHVRAMPAEEFRATAERAKTSAMEPQKKAAFLRHFVSGSHRVVLDKQGRLLVPEEMCKKAALTAEIVLAGGMHKFELWGVDAWEKNWEAENPAYEEASLEMGL